jgi:hypothetical protein
MKLHLILLASLIHLSSGFEVELKGPLNEEACTGNEYDNFASCVAQGVALDPNLAELTDLVGDSFMNPISDRKLQTVNYCNRCRGNEPRGTYCFTRCNQNMRRLEDLGTVTSNLRGVVQESGSVVFKDNEYCPANGEAQQLAKAIIECLSNDYACLGDPADMTLTVTL